MNTFGSLFFQITTESVLIWKKSEPKVFKWSEFHFYEVTSYKIHTLVIEIFFTLHRYCTVTAQYWCSVEWPMLWHIMKNSLHNEGTYKWVNWAPIFFWYKLLPTTSGPQKFAKISIFKVDRFVLSIFLVPKLRSVAQTEWKKHPYLFFLLLVQK